MSEVCTCFKTAQRSHSLGWAQEVKLFSQWSSEGLTGQKSIMSMSSDICKFCTCVTGCLQFTDIREMAFSSPEPVVFFLVKWSWNEGFWKQPLPDTRKLRTSGHACAEITNITAHAHNGFLSLAAPLGKAFYFLSSLQRAASLGSFETRTDFTQLRFIDNLESKGYDINKNQLNTLLGCKTETVNRRLLSEFKNVSSRLVKTNSRKARSRRSKVSCSTSCKCYFRYSETCIN